MTKQTFKPGQKIEYIGKGFLGFIKTEPHATFLNYTGLTDAYIMYKGDKVLVRKYEIK